MTIWVFHAVPPLNQADEAKAKAEADKVTAIKTECQADLAEAMPAFNAALKVWRGSWRRSHLLSTHGHTAHAIHAAHLDHSGVWGAGCGVWGTGLYMLSCLSSIPIWQ